MIRNQKKEIKEFVESTQVNPKEQTAYVANSIQEKQGEQK